MGRGAKPSGSLSVTTTRVSLRDEVQRKVSNGVAQLAAAGSSLDRPKSFHRGDAVPAMANVRASIPAEDLGTRPELRLPTPQFKRE